MANPYALPIKGECKLEDVLYWVYEREVIRLQKLHNVPSPWTTDPILSTYRFCNVDRKNDKVSSWLIYNVYESRKSRSDLWLTTLICRLINWPPTLEKLLKRYDPKHAEEFDPDKFCEVLQGIVDSSEKSYGGAYVVYPGHEPGVKKSEFLAHKVISSAVDRRENIRSAIESCSVELSVLQLSECFGVSTFMSGQAVSDLTYIEDQLDKAKDLYTYAPQGPGSVRGLNRLCGRSLNAVWGQVEFNNELRSINEKIISELGFENLSLHSVQNVMCEMDKYWRVLNSEGRPRTRYCLETSF